MLGFTLQIPTVPKFLPRPDKEVGGDANRNSMVAPSVPPEQINNFVYSSPENRLVLDFGDISLDGPAPSAVPPPRPRSQLSGRSSPDSTKSSLSLLSKMKRATLTRSRRKSAASAAAIEQEDYYANPQQLLASNNGGRSSVSPCPSTATTTSSSRIVKPSVAPPPPPVSRMSAPALPSAPAPAAPVSTASRRDSMPPPPPPTRTTPLRSNSVIVATEPEAIKNGSTHEPTKVGEEKKPIKSEEKSGDDLGELEDFKIDLDTKESVRNVIVRTVHVPLPPNINAIRTFF